MTITIENGKRSAQQIASLSTALYLKANAKYKKLIIDYLGHFPLALAIGHLLRVNPRLEDSPDVTKDGRRGFMFARRRYAIQADIDWDKLDTPRTGAYIWGRDINDTSLTFYTSNSSLFSQPDVDFWRTAYLRHALGDTPFQMIWDIRGNSHDTVYESLLYAVNDLHRKLPGWPIIKLKKTVFVDCEFVYQIGLRVGKFTTEGFGIQPVLTENNYKEMHLE